MGQKEEIVLYPDGWPEGLVAEPKGEIDSRIWFYHSTGFVSDIYWRYPIEEWVHIAMKDGWIPYVGDDRFIHWKRKHGDTRRV